jgi:hypothetical protein
MEKHFVFYLLLPCWTAGKPVGITVEGQFVLRLRTNRTARGHLIVTAKRLYLPFDLSI